MLTSRGGVRCWGYHAFGAIGDGTTTNRPTPARVVGLQSGVVAISAGGLFACAVNANGVAKCWGFNGSGQVGDGSTVNRLVPAQVRGLRSQVAAVTASNDHIRARMTDGSLRCWGSNTHGELGDGTRTDRHTPVAERTRSARLSRAKTYQHGPLDPAGPTHR